MGMKGLGLWIVFYICVWENVREVNQRGYDGVYIYIYTVYIYIYIHMYIYIYIYACNVMKICHLLTISCMDLSSSAWF